MLRLTLVTPTKKMAMDIPVEEVFVPGERGELNILSGHAPLVTVLHTGVLRYREQGATELKAVAISWGYCEVYAEAVTILAETAEFPGEIEIKRAQTALEKAEKELADFGSDVYAFDKYHMKAERARARLTVAETHKE